LYSVFVTHARWGHDNDSAAAVYSGGDGPCTDGEEPVQRETDGAAGGSTVDRDDQVGSRKQEMKNLDEQVTSQKSNFFKETCYFVTSKSFFFYSIIFFFICYITLFYLIEDVFI